MVDLVVLSVYFAADAFCWPIFMFMNFFSSSLSMQSNMVFPKLVLLLAF